MISKFLLGLFAKFEQNYSIKRIARTMQKTYRYYAELYLDDADAVNYLCGNRYLIPFFQDIWERWLIFLSRISGIRSGFFHKQMYDLFTINYVIIKDYVTIILNLYIT